MSDRAWKVVFDSVIGTSHQNSNLPCQDACRVAQIENKQGTLLIACAADGAGSAQFAEEGANIACDTFMNAVKRASLDENQVIYDRSAALGWISEIRACIEERASNLLVEPRQLAATFLGAVVGESEAAFFQVGDGAIVKRSSDEYHPVFWPQTGEYANITNFVTSDNIENLYEWCHYDIRIDEIALFTDGLERLILNYADHTVHVPFLLPMFAVLQRAENATDYLEPLRAFLNASNVNERTDDDKTLILATRVNCFSSNDDIC